MKPKEQLISEIVERMEKLNLLIHEYKPESWMSCALTIDQLKSLIFIQSKEKISFKDLADALNINRSNVTGIADRLIKAGLASRQQSLEDRRVQFLTLTDKGREVLGDLKQGMVTQQLEVLSKLNIEDLSALAQGVFAFTKAAEEYLLSHKFPSDLS